MSHLLPLLLMVPVLEAPPSAGPDQIHLLSDGSRVEGAVHVRKQEVRLTTPFGERTVPRVMYKGPDQVAVDQLRHWYRAEAKGLSRKDLAGQRALAEQCRERGYLTGLRRQLNAILAADTDDRWARMILSRLCGHYRVHKWEGKTEGRELRRYIDFLFEKLARRDNVGAVMAAEKARQLPRDLVYRPAIKALKRSKPRVRWLGAHMLRDYTGKPARVQELYRASLGDGVWAVRREAVRSLKSSGSDGLVNLYSKQLTHPEQMIRVRAAQALGALGDKTAAKHLVRALADTWKPRHVHIVSTTQRAYVKDFDVEVAQTAFIADPIVDVLQDGAVLDVAVISIGIVRRVYRDALVGVTGVDHGTDVSAWKKALGS